MGIFASEDIQPSDQSILLIPYGFMLTAERIKELETFRKIFEDSDSLSLTDEEILSLYLVYFKYCTEQTKKKKDEESIDNAQNPMKLWIDGMPNKYNSILYFTPQELEKLNGSHLYDDAKIFIESQKKRFEDITSKIINQQPEIFRCIINWKLWRWAIAVVRSRSVQILDESGNPFPALIPYFDFFNHQASQDKYSWGYSSSSKVFHVEMLSGVPKGDQIYQSYGHVSNGELLYNYGFILEDNPFNYVPIQYYFLGIDPEDPAHDQKTKLVEKYRSMNDTRLAMFRNSVTTELLQAAEIITAHPDDVQDDNTLAKELSVESKIMRAQWFQLVCQTKLSEYPTSLKDDLDFMASTKFKKMTKKAQMAFTVVKEEKEILFSIYQLFYNMEKELESQLGTSESSQHDELQSLTTFE